MTVKSSLGSETEVAERDYFEYALALVQILIRY